ncbi:MAG: hypothetical protein HY922_03580 [Elusimicrobia bacterium]|nr:hypothetical protein [Elusimicrobiota bacterium]
MGILRSREEQIPVTCAVINDSGRRDFFNKVRKKAGRVERIAQVCGVSASTVSDWMSGQCLIPYHALQRMAQEFGVEAPRVSELRREMQAVSEVRPAARPRPAPAPKPAKAQARPRAKAPRGKQQARKPTVAQKSASPRPPPTGAEERRPPGTALPRTRPPRKPAAKERRKKAPAQPHKKAVPAPKAKSGEVKYSEQLAYWTGVTFSAGRCEGTELRLAADRRMGQNFAGAWARLTESLFGAKPVLSMTEDRRAQIAALPMGAAGDFIAKLGLKPGSGPAEAPAAPRWIWSSPAWKTAFLKGAVDAASHFHRTPAVKLLGLSEALRKSVHKILSSLAFAPKLPPDGTVSIEGAQEVEKYFESVGTGNFKLRDQFSAFRKSRSGAGRPRRRHPAPEEAAPAQAPAPEEPAAVSAEQEEAAPQELPVESEAPEQIDIPLPDATPSSDYSD